MEESSVVSVISVAEVADSNSVEENRRDDPPKNQVSPLLNQQTSLLDSRNDENQSDHDATKPSTDLEKSETTTEHTNDEASVPVEAIKPDDALKLGSTEEVLASADSLLQNLRIERMRSGSLEIDLSSNDISSEEEIHHFYSQGERDLTPKYEQIISFVASQDKNPLFSEGGNNKHSHTDCEMVQSEDGNQDSQTRSPTQFRGVVEIGSDDGHETVSNDVTIPKSTCNEITKVEDMSIHEIEPTIIRSLVAKEENYEGMQISTWFSIFNDSTKDSMASGSDALRSVDVGSSRLPIPNSVVKAIHGKNSKKSDSQMPDWIKNQASDTKDNSLGNTYTLGESRTVIVHEIMREGWTWAIDWSPNGDMLAVATDNHHLAIIDAISSPVWRVKHDKRMSGAQRKGTGSIRCVAWGNHFIAIGGTGDAVSILAPTEPYPVIHNLSVGTYVGSIDWRCKSKTLIAGNRDGRVRIFGIGSTEEDDDFGSGRKGIYSRLLKTIDLKPAWINAVKFSPDGSVFAVGDDDGILRVYSFGVGDGTQIETSNVANFKMADSILSIEWSPDGKWLYCGGKDFAITIIKANDGWEAIHRINRERWVQFLACSCGGSHLAVGGLSSEVSILDVNCEWKTAVKLDLKGMNPLSAKWHPRDQFLVMAGQQSSILAVETTKSSYVQGHCLHSISPILSIDFSPDGQMAIVGNRDGVVTIFKVAGYAFSVCYEMVLDCHASLSIQWSQNGAFVVISSESKMIILSRRNQGDSAPLGTSGFAIAKVIRDIGNICSVTVDPRSQFIAVCGSEPSILDATSNFKKVCDIGTIKNSIPLPGSSNFSNVLSTRSLSLAASWSSDGNWLAMVGRNQNLAFFDTSSESISDWRKLFEVQTTQAGHALAWGPPTETGLQYCAYGGEDKRVCILEIRDTERSWERVLEIPRNGVVYDLDWGKDGLLAAAISGGTVTIMDLSYLKCGLAVNEMDYNWQRQALTCFVEIQRNKGKNCMRTLRWIPSSSCGHSDRFLAIGGTDGEIEVLNLTTTAAAQ